MHRRFPRFIACAVAWLALCSCVSGNTVGGTGTIAAQVIPTSGGALGTTCPKEDQIGCAPGSKAKVRCKGGAWVDDGICAGFESCSETKNGSDVVATVCKVPPTKHQDRAMWCAKAGACLKGSFSSCMNPPPITAMQKTAAITGIIEPEDLLAHSLAPYANCIQTAKDCDGVRACVKSGSLSCTGQSTGSCTGSKATFCEKTTPVTVDCSLVGLPCHHLTISEGGKSANLALCANLAPCSAPKTVTCNGAMASSCLPLTPSNSMAIQINCGLLGTACDPAAKFDDDPDVCKTPPGPACDSQTYVATCTGNVRKTCSSKGMVTEFDCAKVGLSCVLLDGGSNPYPSCKVPTTCGDFTSSTGIPAGYTDTVITFCDGMSGVATFDCALAGMKSNGYECSFDDSLAP